MDNQQNQQNQQINQEAIDKMADWIHTQKGTYFLGNVQRHQVAEAFIKQLSDFGFILTRKTNE